MTAQQKSLEEVQASLKALRENPNFRNRFPKKIWDSIINLTKALPLQDVCRQLEIQPAYLKRKIQQSQKAPSDAIDFKEVLCGVQGPQLDTVVIELMSDSGLRARIQGPSTCLNCLSSLFGGK
jgi:hypothetical protein